jgi:putative transposase
VFITQKYKLYPDKFSRKELADVLHLQRCLYNAALQERIEAYKKSKKSITLFDQNKSLTIIRKDDPAYSAIPSTLSRGTLQRLDEAFKGFFKRVKKSQAGFPRFKKELKSMQFSEFTGIRIIGSQIHIKGMIPIQVNLHRAILGDIRSCVIKQDRTNDWWICFQVKIKHKKQERTGNSVGIDSGLKHLLVTSDGEFIKNIRPSKLKSKKMRRQQRVLARAQRASHQRTKKKIKLARLHRHITDIRATYLHQVSARLVKENDAIYAENLNLRGLMKSTLAFSFSDAGIGRLHNMISYKAEWAGKVFKQVDPKYTSQTCSHCGHRQKMPLSMRTYKCEPCGLEMDRDINAAINILHKGAMPLGVPKPTGAKTHELVAFSQRNLSFERYQVKVLN